MVLDDPLAGGLGHLDELVRMLAEGLMTMLKIQAQQGEMLKEILAACTASDDGESPLVKAILKLDQSILTQTTTLNAHTAMLTRIETKVSR